MRLDSLLTIKGGKRLPLGDALTKIKTSHIYIRVSDMKNNTIDDSDLHYITETTYEKIRNYIITQDDLYIVIVGSTIGKVGSVPEKFNNMNLTENAARLIPILINKDYLLMILQTKFMQSQFMDKTKQVGQPKLALNRLKDALCPIPSLEEQHRIVNAVNNIFSKIKDES